MCVCVCPLLLHCSQEEKLAVAKAKGFLESNTYSADDPYTTALSAYALALLRSPYAPLALRRLNHMAITQGSYRTLPSLLPRVLLTSCFLRGRQDGGPGPFWMR